MLKKKNFQHFGNKNHQWVEENPSYTSVHKWLDRHFIKSKKCEHCGSSRFVEWALKTGKKHTHNRDDYLCLCSSCHKKYDYTPERKKKLSASLKLVPHTKEWAAKIAKANKGLVRSEKTKKKISEYNKKHPRPRDDKGRFFR
jgi:hypothetical protein